MLKFRFTLIVILLISFTSNAQIDTLTLQSAIDMAIDNNPEINKLRASIEEKQQQWRLYTGIADPEFLYSKEGLSNSAENTNYEQRFSVSQSIDFPTTIIFRQQAIKQELEAMKFQLKARKRDLKATVKNRYIDLLFSLYTIDLMNKKIQLTDELYNAAYSREESGVGTGMELLNAEIRQAEARNDLDNAQAMLHQSRYGLFNVVGLEIEDQSYDIRFADTLRTYSERIDQEKALDFLEEQPEYIAAQKKWQAAGKKLKEARSNILPDLSVGYFQQDFGNGFDFHGFEVGLKLPIWAPFKYQGEVKTAQARRRQLQWEKIRVKLMMKESIEKAWHGYENSVSTIDRFNKTISSKAELLQKLTMEGYRIGEINLLTLLDAQQTYLRSQQRYLKALRNHYKQLVNLEKYIGDEIVY